MNVHCGWFAPGALLAIALLTLNAAPAPAEDERSLREEIARAEQGDEAALQALRDRAAPEQLVSALREGPEAWPDSPVGRVEGHIQAAGRANPFILRVPEDYTPERAWPLHISLHGGGRSPEVNCDQHWREGLVDRGLILLCPGDVRGNWWTWWGEETLMAALRYVRERYRVDGDRTSIGGASLGGQGTWMAATRYPWLWRAATPRCAVLLRPERLLRNVGALPLYIVHGAEDVLVPPAASRRARSQVEAVGARLRYEELPDIGHSFMAVHNPAVADWLLSQPPRTPQAAFAYETMGDRPPPDRIHWLRVGWPTPWQGRAQMVRGHVRSAAECDWSPSESCPEVNEVELEVTGAPTRVTLLLPEPLWEPTRPLRVTYNGRVVFTGVLEPSARAVVQSWRDLHDPTLLPPWSLEIEPQPGDARTWEKGVREREARESFQRRQRPEAARRGGRAP
ncbi:MAG: hypothetical protein CMH57_12995, partial [Myxococcales bacterium]|nr:hypothetical protein [Myxococcales bacterium]